MEARLSPTSTFATLHVRPAEAVTLSAGFDNRRNVRLYRDAITPETAFDDSFRLGAWGLSVELARRYRVSFDARSSSGGSAGSATAYTGSLGATRLTSLHGELRLRTTRYHGPRISGWIYAASLAAEPAPWARAELNGGVRDERNPLEAPSDYRVGWVGADLDLSLARGWYLMLSGTLERGSLDANDQVYGGLSYRF